MPFIWPNKSLLARRALQMNSVGSSRHLYFVTGNENKFKEAAAMIDGLQLLRLDLPEIQDLDARRIIEAKLIEAMKQQQGAFIVEDTSLHLDCLAGFPGPLIKWFTKAIGNAGIYQLVSKYGNSRALARTIIGYSRDGRQVHFFEGILAGQIVDPSGSAGFGWDPIFMPDGHKESLANMSIVEKNSISMRRKAFEQLQVFLKNNLA